MLYNNMFVYGDVCKFQFSDINKLLYDNFI